VFETSYPGGGLPEPVRLVEQLGPVHMALGATLGTVLDAALGVYETPYPGGGLPQPVWLVEQLGPWLQLPLGVILGATVSCLVGAAVSEWVGDNVGATVSRLVGAAVSSSESWSPPPQPQ